MPESDPYDPASYPLPATDVPDDVRSELHPWVGGFIGMRPAEATKRLHEHWATIERPSLRALRETLGEFEVREIVQYPDGGRIYAVRPNTDEDDIGNSFYLPAPLDPDELDAHLKAVSLSQNDSVREFLTHFAGWAEDVRISGDFVYREASWPTFTDSWEDTIAGFDEWKDSLMIYNARNGCQVLVHPRGNVAWWMFQERRVADLAPDFDGFIRQFSEYRKLAWPYDPYGP